MPTKPDLTKPTQHPATTEPLISIRDLRVEYALRTNAIARLIGRSSGTVKAVDGIDLDIARGEVVGVVGESGSGKSTLGRALLGLVPATGGSIRYGGQELTGLGERRMRGMRRRLQMVFQDPHASLNPSMTIGTAISDVLRIHGLAERNRQATVVEVLERVGLAPAERFMGKYPGELSGGQKQRAVIARALALDPDVLVADEPISMLDMSVRAKILGLLDDLKRELGLTYLYITHDLASARFFCDRIAIMYLGKIIEIGPTEEIFANPRHPYTRALLGAIPDPDPSRGVPRDLPRGEVPDAARPPRGCPFHPRCPKAFEPCGWETADLPMIFDQRWAAVPEEQFAREAKLVPDPTAVDAQVADLLQDERTRNPDDPFWKGVRSIDASGVTFQEPYVPHLLPVADSPVEVSCHLYADPRPAGP